MGQMLQHVERRSALEIKKDKMQRFRTVPYGQCHAPTDEQSGLSRSGGAGHHGMGSGVNQIDRERCMSSHADVAAGGIGLEPAAYYAAPYQRIVIEMMQLLEVDAGNS